MPNCSASPFPDEDPRSKIDAETGKKLGTLNAIGGATDSNKERPEQTSPLFLSRDQGFYLDEQDQVAERQDGPSSKKLLTVSRTTDVLNGLVR